MLVEALITPDFPRLEPHLTLDEILETMAEAKADELVLVSEENRPLAIIDRSTVSQIMGPEDDLETIGLSNFTKAQVLASQHFFEAIRVMAENRLQTVAVADNDGYYVGSVQRDRVFDSLGQWLTITTPGSIVVVETDWVGYSLQEIGALVESNGIRVLGIITQQIPGSDRIYVTIKLNEGNAPSVVHALERYGYTVAYTFFPPEQSSNLQENYDALMRFLDL